MLRLVLPLFVIPKLFADSFKFENFNPIEIQETNSGYWCQIKLINHKSQNAKYLRERKKQSLQIKINLRSQS